EVWSMSPRKRMILALAGCLWFGASASAQEATPTYSVKPGDILAISVWKEPDLQDDAVLVRPDGMFSFPLVGQVDARDKSVAELQQFITDSLARFIADPVVTVSVQEIRGNKVFVIGQV